MVNKYAPKQAALPADANNVRAPLADIRLANGVGLSEYHPLVIKETVRYNSDGSLGRYTLVYVDPRIWGGRDGERRVLNYGNDEQHDHVHHLGRRRPIGKFPGLKRIQQHFREKVLRYLQKVDEKAATDLRGQGW